MKPITNTPRVIAKSVNENASALSVVTPKRPKVPTREASRTPIPPMDIGRNNAKDKMATIQHQSTKLITIPIFKASAI